MKANVVHVVYVGTEQMDVPVWPVLQVPHHLRRIGIAVADKCPGSYRRVDVHHDFFAQTSLVGGRLTVDAGRVVRPLAIRGDHFVWI